MKENLKETCFLLSIFAICISIVTGCNMQIVDTTWHYQKAHIKGISSSNEWTTVEIASWKDYEQSDVVQIKTKDGKTYLTHYNNIVLETN